MPGVNRGKLQCPEKVVALERDSIAQMAGRDVGKGDRWRHCSNTQRLSQDFSSPHAWIAEMKHFLSLVPILVECSCPREMVCRETVVRASSGVYGGKLKPSLST